MIPSPDAVWSLPSRHLGRRVHVYRCLDSTNTLAMALAEDPSLHGLVLLAHEQTAGRGQYGRSWQAPPGSSVLMSVLLFPPRSLHRPALLTAWAAVSVCETIHTLSELQASIKWPNDVFVHGKKVCGILIEQRTTRHAQSPLAMVLGIGLNLTQSPEVFEQAGLLQAGSLRSVSGTIFPYEDTVSLLIHQLDERYQQLLDNEVAELEAGWKSRLGVLGKDVVVEGVHHSYHGRLRNVTLAAVELQLPSGELLQLTPESIRHLSLQS